MSHGLLIFDQEVLSDLYAINLRVYTASNITVKNQFNDALKLIELSPNLDFIISLTALDDKNIGQQIVDYLAKKELSIPIIFLGKNSYTPSEYPIIEDFFDFKNLIREVAKILGITAQDMSKLPVSPYFSIPFNIFQKQDFAYCDAYKKIAKGANDFEYIKIFKKDESLILHQKEENIDKIYIESINRLKFVNHITQNMTNLLSTTDSDSEGKIKSSSQAMNIFAQMMDSVSEEAYEQLTEISKNCINSVKSVVSSAPSLQDLTDLLMKNKQNYIYAHGVLSNYVCSHIIKKSTWGNREQLEKMNLIIFYHDIHLLPIYLKYNFNGPEEELLRIPDLTDDEIKIIEDHALLAANMIRNLRRIPHGVDLIICQHHGAKNGIGLDNGFPDDISTLSKVLMISEAFTKEFNKSLGGEKFNLSNTLDYLKDHFKKNSYKNLIDALQDLKI